MSPGVECRLSHIIELTRAANPSNVPLSTTDKIPNAFATPAFATWRSLATDCLYTSSSVRCFSTCSTCFLTSRNSRKLAIWKPTTIVTHTPISEAIIPIKASVVIVPSFLMFPPKC